jgi:hypothetical protein
MASSPTPYTSVPITLSANRTSCGIGARGKVPRDTSRGRRHTVLGVSLFARGHCLQSKESPLCLPKPQ